MAHMISLLSNLSEGIIVWVVGNLSVTGSL